MDYKAPTLIAKHIWIYHITNILYMCIVWLETSGSCYYGEHNFQSCPWYPGLYSAINHGKFKCALGRVSAEGPSTHMSSTRGSFNTHETYQAPSSPSLPWQCSHSRKLQSCRQSPIIAEEVVPADDGRCWELFPASGFFREGIGTERK